MNLGSIMGTTSPTTQAGAAKPASTSPSGPVDPSGTPINDTTNYLGMGMSKSAYEAMYGTGNQQGAAAAGAAAGATAAGNNQVNNPAVNPNLPNSTVPGSAAMLAKAPPTYGTQSGPGVLDQWFNERASGTDPAYEYETKRGLTSLDNAAAARGGYNGGASMQQDSDYLANMGAQREGQLDSLATGASGENQANLNSMLGLGMGLAGGEGSMGTAYDVGGANAMSAANTTGLGLGAQGVGLQYGANQNLINNGAGLASLLALA